jgi:hexaprenyl-diphosphate synthase
MVMAVSYALNAQTSYKRKAEDVFPLQKRLAEIVEMIHTASLFHDDVIDKAITRRGIPSVNQVSLSWSN